MDFDDAVIIYDEKSGKKYAEYLKKNLEKGFQRVCTSYDISKLNEIEIKKEFINSCYVIALITEDYRSVPESNNLNEISAINNGNSLKYNKLIRLSKKSIELEKYLMVYLLDDLNLDIFTNSENNGIDENKIDEKEFIHKKFSDSRDLTDKVSSGITEIKENMEIAINKLCDSKFNLANLYVFLNFLEDASNEYESILELCPEYGDAKNNHNLIEKYLLRKRYENKYNSELLDKNAEEESAEENMEIKEIKETKENNKIEPMKKDIEDMGEIVHSIKEKLKEDELNYKSESLEEFEKNEELKQVEEFEKIENSFVKKNEHALKFKVPSLSDLKEEKIIEKETDAFKPAEVETDTSKTSKMENIHKKPVFETKKTSWPKEKPEVKIEVHEQKISMNEGIPEKEIIKTEKALDDENDIVINSFEDTEKTEDVHSKELWHKTKITPLKSLQSITSPKSSEDIEEYTSMEETPTKPVSKHIKSDNGLIDGLKKGIDDEYIHDKSMVEHYIEGLIEEIFPKKEDEKHEPIEKPDKERIKYVPYDKKEEFNKRCYDEDISANEVVNSKKNINEKDHIESQNHLNDSTNYQYTNQDTQNIKNGSDEEEYKRLLTKANEYYTSGDYKNAEKKYRKAIMMHSNVAEAHNNLGCLLDNLGNLEEAEHEYRQALEVDPQYMKAHNNLATILGHMGRYEEAEEQYNKALDLNPDYWEARYNLSMMHASNKEYEQAISEIKKLSKYFRKNGEIKEALQLKKLVKSLKKMAHLESDETKENKESK
ncbi:tetratricopeptide repeat protein [Methanococcus voltae]|uniref:TPR repeat-containing protein n=1 Tax=Methanococcus voltae (strain ATCC BAA-1334 / A3) TaxID=456320 RepID=D7DS09_METV3|nr:tetratricopeptide repeat protein [Methanococcus voltae]MCS3901444.1 tetratricopeptide (TPR) repeat protein [Methanococcus voltae]